MMKRLILTCALFSSAFSFSQVISENVAWPSANWTLSGTYAASAVLSSPTTGATFSFDDNAAGTGSIDQIIATSPLLDLSTAYLAGEGELTLTGTAIFNTNSGGDALSIEYYNADSMQWYSVFDYTAIPDPLGLGLYQNCSGTSNYTATVNFANFSPNALSNFQYRFIYDDNGGQQRGFCINPPTVTSSSACATPTNGSASNILDTVADLGWVENGSATTWLVEILEAGNTPTRNGISAASNPYSASPLLANTAYEFYVAAECGAENSTYAGPFAFSTLETIICNDPTNLSANNIIDTAATLLWTENGTATLYDIELLDSTATATGIPTDSAIGNPYQAIGLTPNTPYQYYVRSQCTGTTSGWSGPHYFRTKNSTSCAQPSALGANNLTTSDAELFWTENGSATTWDIELVTLGAAPTGTPTHAAVGNPYTVTGLDQDTDYEFYVRADCGAEQSFYAGPFSFTTISGIEEQQLIAFTISPNPTNGLIKLELGEPNESSIVTVYDARGKLIKAMQVNGDETIINLENENSGIYLIQVSNDRGKATKRLIKH